MLRSMAGPAWSRRWPHGVAESAARITDVAVAAAVLVAVSVPFVFPVDPAAPAPGALGYVLAAGTAVPLAWRRQAPFACALVVAGFTVSSVLYDRPGQPLQYGAAVAVYSVAAHGAPWQRRGLLVAWVSGVLVVSLVAGDRDPAGIGFALLTIVCAHSLGRLSATRHEQVERAESEARRQALLAALEADRAADAERRRIARDMHDIVAHAVSVMIVQAEAGAATSAAGAPATTAHYDAIAEAGRGAIEQLRRVLSVLRDNERPDDMEIGGSAGLQRVVRRVEATGLSVDVHAPDLVDDVPAEVAVAVHRAVQESLTNTLRHAGATSAIVDLSRQGEHLLLTITDDGRHSTGVQPAVAGRGLIGIRERAAACGGTAYAGPRPGGGFQVRVVLPLRASESVGT